MLKGIITQEVLGRQEEGAHYVQPAPPAFAVAPEGLPRRQVMKELVVAFGHECFKPMPGHRGNVRASGQGCRIFWQSASNRVQMPNLEEQRHGEHQTGCGNASAHLPRLLGRRSRRQENGEEGQCKNMVPPHHGRDAQEQRSPDQQPAFSTQVIANQKSQAKEHRAKRTICRLQ